MLPVTGKFRPGQGQHHQGQAHTDVFVIRLRPLLMQRSRTIPISCINQAHHTRNPVLSRYHSVQTGNSRPLGRIHLIGLAGRSPSTLRANRVVKLERKTRRRRTRPEVNLERVLLNLHLHTDKSCGEVDVQAKSGTTQSPFSVMLSPRCRTTPRCVPTSLNGQTHRHVGGTANQDPVARKTQGRGSRH